MADKNIFIPKNSDRGEHPNPISYEIKQAILELDPDATFEGTTINTCLDYSIIQDIICNN